MKPVLSLHPVELLKSVFSVREFRGDEERSAARGRVSVYALPDKDRMYTEGFDSAMGIQGRDQTAFSLFDKTAQRENQGRSPQVCEAAGWWGPEISDRLAFALHRWYNGAFVMGEAQGGGLPVLRKLWDEYGVQWMYYDKSVGSAAAIPATNPRLGWNRTANDVTLTAFIQSIRNRTVELRSVQLLEQMGRLRWKPRGKQAERDERVGDDKLQAKLDGGGSPDLIMASMYGSYALGQVHQFEKPKPTFAPGSYGDMFKLAEKYPEIFPAPKAAGWTSSNRG